ncbi:serine/threonine-protein phosphatase 6 regulatory ankyrin repeat subunit C-like [Mytilus trossulus]|uniref:serine/threonine-protein phosphatase 6 regulatory ankyrin repeat subunit C-like n=1 Tax=Mytilus trossulus TaxID=6551 RepID=UPI0030059E0F
MATSQPQEDVMFLRLAGLLLRIAPRAVRRWFDNEFHPDRLNQFLRKNRHKIDGMKCKERVISQAMYNLLYPRGLSGVSSDKFDISLMICLMRHFADLDIQDNLPSKTMHTTAADISRIKFYRNYIVHSDNGKVTEDRFSEIWNCVEEAIVRLLPDIKPEIDDLKISSLTNVGDIKHILRLEKELEKNNQHLSAINQKLQTLDIQHNNNREIHQRILKEWRVTDVKYVSTSATTFIYKSLQKNRSVIITGSPGCGKSAAAHHVALELEKEGYEIVPCDDPSEITQHLTTEKFQVFMIDDVCGKFALNQQKVNSWDQYEDKLNLLLESNQNNDKEDSANKSEEGGSSKSKGDCFSKYNEENSTQFKEDSFKRNKVKFIITCRENIYVHKAFPKLNCLSHIQCSFSTNYKISQDEMNEIALSYLSEDTTMTIPNIFLYDFFPLICVLYSKKVNRDQTFFTHPVEIIGNEISEMKIKSESHFLCLSLLVLKNNFISEDDFRSGDMEQLITDICRNCQFESFVSMVSIQNCFESLNGIYVIEVGGIYTAIHDKMFDIISTAIAPSLINCLIKFADIKFIANRIQLLSLGKSSLPCVVYIEPEYKNMYLNRQYKEAMKGNYWEVFGGIQTENEAYRSLLLSFLKEQDKLLQTCYVPGDDGLTPLFVSSSLGYIDFVKYFVVKCLHCINEKDKEGISPFYIACKNGHIAVVKHLIKYYKDVNAEMVYKTTALSAVCYNGHTDVAQLLLDNNADINRANKKNENALHYACGGGNVQMVILLLRAYNMDTLNNTNEQTTLHIACKKELKQIVTPARAFCRDVNQQCDPGFTPLYIACRQGHYETVKLLLDLNRQTNNCVDTTIKDNKGCSILHAASFSGCTAIVKLLIDVGMNVNDTSTEGLTPLYVACQLGHFDTVKFLLDLKGKTSKSCVDTGILVMNGWSALHIACNNGNTEVVKLLVDAGMNIKGSSNARRTPLFLACENGHYDTVKYLLCLNGKTSNDRVDATIKDEGGSEVLHAACSKGHTEIVKLLFDVGMHINDTSIEGYTPLYLACMYGHYDTVKFLLDLNGEKFDSCVDTTIKHIEGWSVLHVACFKGHTGVIKLLIKIGININETSTNGSTPLYLACKNGHYETVKYLLDLNGKTLNSVVDTTIKDEYGWSMLHAACSNGHKEVVKLLVDAGLNVNDITNEGVTSFLIACWDGHYDTIKYLLDLNDQTLSSRVNTTIKDKYGWSVLHTASVNGHTEVVKLLIDDGLDVNDTTQIGCTPLLLACQNGHYDIVKHLLDLNGDTLNSCVDTTIKDEYGWSVLHEACFQGHTNMVRLLITANVKINDKTKYGSTPLYLACQNGHYETVNFLLDLNDKKSNNLVDTTVNYDDGRSVLHTACFNGHTEVVKLLIEIGLNVNDRQKNGFTPLYLACLKGHYETVKYLLDLNGDKLNSRVDTTLKDTQGNSALHAAFSNQHTDVVQLLTEYGNCEAEQRHSITEYCVIS